MNSDLFYTIFKLGKRGVTTPVDHTPVVTH